MASRPRGYVALALVAVLTAAGCSSASPQSPPTGIDELVIPTPSPDPADFVPSIDNPWLPSRPGHGLELHAVDRRPRVPGLGHRAPGPARGAGVATTVVETDRPALDGRPHGDPDRTDYYAQDRHGNVWWFGREGVWRAAGGRRRGRAGHAGHGSGRRRLAGGVAPGVVDVRETVVTRDQTESTPAGRYTDLLGIDVKDALEPDSQRRRFFARGLGLVEEISTRARSTSPSCSPSLRRTVGVGGCSAGGAGSPGLAASVA